MAPCLPPPPLLERLERLGLRVEGMQLSEWLASPPQLYPPRALVLLLETPDSAPQSEEACRRLRQASSAQAPLVVLVAHRNAEHVQALYRVGASDFLVWPEDEVFLEVRLQQALRGGAARPGQAAQALGQLADPAQDMLSLHGPEGHFLSASPACEALLGYTPSELQGHELWEYVHAGEEPALRLALRGLASVPGPLSVECRLRHKEGRYLWVELRLGARVEGGQVRELVALSRDISARREADEQLLLLQAAFEHTREAITITTGDLEAPGPTIVYTNPAFTALTGYTAEEVRGRSPRMLQGPATARGVLAELRRRLEAGLPFHGEAVNYRKDGSEFWLEWEVSAIHDKRGAVTHYVGCQRDVTERHRAEQALCESEARLRAAAEGSLDAFWILSAERDGQGQVVDFRVVDINSRGQRLLARERAQLIGQRLGEQVPGLQQAGWIARYTQVLQSGQHLEEELPPASPLGDKWFYHQVIPLEGGVAVTARDISARKQMEESLRRSETMSTLGALIAGVAHEARNPLFAISSALDAFENRFGARPDYARYLQLFREEIGRLGQLLGDLLEYGRPLSSRLEPAPLVPVIEEAIRLCKAVAEHHRVSISWRPPAHELPPVPMEPRRLVQVFQNLIQNAIQHSPPSSTVSVWLAQGPESEQLQCTIHDQGPGFRPEDLSRVFEPFFSRRPRGVGLGLSIVQRIIDEHRGRVVVANHPQGGALATVFLPAPSSLTRLPTAA